MQGKTVAIVTGASKGLGQALAKALLNADTTLITVARSRDESLDALAEKAGCTLKQIQADLAQPAAAQHAIEQITAALPGDAQRYLLINNAGTVNPITKADGLSDAEAITAALTLNVTSVMLLTSAFLSAVKPLQADCRILNISSGAGRNPMPGWAVYCASKAALDHYSQVVHAENHGVRIAALAPGVIDTGMQETIRSTNSEHFPNVERFAQMHEQGQLSSPAAVAARIVDYIGHDDFGTTVLDDIRNYA